MNREGIKYGLMKMLTLKLEIEKKNRLLKDKWCEPVPLLHKFLKVYVNLDKKILTLEETSS